MTVNVRWSGENEVEEEEKVTTLTSKDECVESEWSCACWCELLVVLLVMMMCTLARSSWLYIQQSFFLVSVCVAGAAAKINNNNTWTTWLEREENERGSDTIAKTVSITLHSEWRKRSKIKLVYLVPTQTGPRRECEREWRRRNKLWTQIRDSSKQHSNKLLAGIIMLCQCSFDSRCNLYDFCVFLLFFWSRFCGVQLTDSPFSSSRFLKSVATFVLTRIFKRNWFLWNKPTRVQIGETEEELDGVRDKKCNVN